jgi:Putative Ig domain
VPLPPGLTLDTSTGAVTGTPTTAGTCSPVEFEVYDAQYQRYAYCTITVTMSSSPLSVTCAAVNTGDVGVPFDSGPMTVTGGIAPYAYSIVGTLPPGLLGDQHRRCRRTV